MSQEKENTNAEISTLSSKNKINERAAEGDATIGVWAVSPQRNEGRDIKEVNPNNKNK